MGQKVNPHGFRLGITTEHKSRWFADSTKVGQRYRDYVREDVAIRALMSKGMDRAGIARVPRVPAHGRPAVRGGEPVRQRVRRGQPHPRHAPQHGPQRRLRQHGAHALERIGAREHEACVEGALRNDTLLAVYEIGKHAEPLAQEPAWQSGARVARHGLGQQLLQRP